MKYDITMGENSEISIVVSDRKIKEGIGHNPILNVTVRQLYKELLDTQKTKPTVGIGYSDLNGFRNISIYTIYSI
jgi:hypothetical protein